MKKVLYVDMDNVLVDFKTGIEKLDDPTFIEFEGRYDEVLGIFGMMEPVFAGIFAWIWLEQSWNGIQLIGAVVVMCHPPYLAVQSTWVVEMPNSM